MKSATAVTGILSARFLVRNFFNLFFRRRIEFSFDRIPLRAERMSLRKSLNLFRVGLNRFFPIAPALGRPYMAHISPSGICDLSCALCPAGDPSVRGRTLLSYDLFRKFIDEAGDTLLYLILWGWGEPLLNPELSRMISYARSRGILTVCSTNLNRLTPASAGEIVGSGLDALIIALDGASEETAARIRPGASLARTSAYVRMLVSERSRRGATKPFLNLRMVVSRENEGEIDAFRRLGRELGVDMVSFKAFSTRQPGYADPEHDRAFVPVGKKFRWYDYLPDFAADPGRGLYRCKFPWTKPTLFPDGAIAFCEFDLRAEYPLGNIREKSFDEIWFGPRARIFRRAFRRGRAGAAFCRDCVYDYKKIPGCVVDFEDLRP
jgi:radical SAM protein with 4Fe4S-binding SPASM domain